VPKSRQRMLAVLKSKRPPVVPKNRPRLAVRRNKRWLAKKEKPLPVLHRKKLVAWPKNGRHRKSEPGWSRSAKPKPLVLLKPSGSRNKPVLLRKLPLAVRRKKPTAVPHRT
jgi:hypothetical protein